MKEVYNKDYYTIDLIPEYRQDYIDLKLKELITLSGLKYTDWPIDCVKLMEKLKAHQLIPFDYTYEDLSEKQDACIKYFSEYNLYLILINKNKSTYPFQSSKDRRLNFTLAHELAHICLDHLLIPDSIKSKEDKALEDIEADEFAGRLLLPEKLLYSCNYYSFSSAADYFMVSKTALWKRLNNLKRLKLMLPKPISTCPLCGNTHFSVFSEYCGICGRPIRDGLNGIRKTSYPSEIKLDIYKSVTECPLCKFKHFNGDKCARCGTYIFNFCSDYLTHGEEGCSYANLGSSRFCEICGKPTYFYKRGFLSSWEDEINSKEIYY